MSEDSHSYELKVLYPPEEQRSLTIDRAGIIIGRGDDAQLQFEDEWISRRHCRIWLDGDLESSEGARITIWLEDLQSTNGTFLDGQLVDKQNILPGSKVQLGKVVLTVEELNAPSNSIPFVARHQESATDEIVEEKAEKKAEENFAEAIAELSENQSDVRLDEEFDSHLAEGQYEDIPASYQAETQSEIAEQSAFEDLVESLKVWSSQLEAPQNVALFRIKVINLSDFEDQPGSSAIRFLHYEINELLQTEKITDEWIDEIADGDFLFAVHSISAEQADSFALDLQQLIQKQIFSYQGDILTLKVKTGAVVSSLVQINWSLLLENLDEAIQLASKSDKSHILMVN